MSHRKFHQPRRGSLGFLPRKRAKGYRGRIRSFPKDDPEAKPHLTAFMGIKAGMTHVIRELIRPSSRLNKHNIAEAVTIIECPPMQVVGIAGYIETPRGLRTLATVWSNTLSRDFRKRFYKNWYASKKKAFTKYIDNFSNENFTANINKINKYCTVIRLIAHTTGRHGKDKSQRKANILEIQVNGGTSTFEKLNYGQKLLDKKIRINDFIEEGEMLDVIGITKGYGTSGVRKRFGTKLLPRKTHRGYRRVGCIGAWHPARVQWTVPRAGQLGYHHRTEIGKRVFMIGKSKKESEGPSPLTKNDLTEKFITPMGGFPHYGEIEYDWVMIKGSCMGAKGRPVILRRQIYENCSRRAKEELTIKFVDTSSKIGHGKFQTSDEKAKFYGLRVKNKR